MKYALVLASDLKKRDWICYLIVNSLSEIDNLNCYQAGFIKLPKAQYHGTADPNPVYKKSCATGNRSEFRIVTIQNLRMSGDFNLA